MTRLFANVYLDEDVDVVIASLLRSRQVVAVTAHEAGQRGKTDLEQLLFAAERRLAILTHNRSDFEKLAASFAETKRFHAGIIIAVRRPPYGILPKLLQLLNDWTADEMDNQVFYI